MPTQYQLTDQAIFSAVAAGGVILSKVPASGTDKIQIRRIDSSGRAVLQDLEGSAIKTAFGVDRFHWDGKTDMCGPLQKASFKNHGKDTAGGSKPTYKNITVSGMPEYVAPEPKLSPVKPSSPARTAAASPSAKRKFDRFTSDMSEAELAELQVHVRSTIAAKKAAKKSAESEKKKMQAKLQKMQADEAKLQAERAKLQAALDAMDTGGASAAAVAASPAKAVVASPAKAATPEKDTVMEEEEVEEEEEAEEEEEFESGSESDSEGEEESCDDEEESCEEEEDDDICTAFSGSKSVVQRHFEYIVGTAAPVSFSRPKMRSLLIMQHYSSEQLRTLADSVSIDGRITTAAALRSKLIAHFGLE